MIGVGPEGPLGPPVAAAAVLADRRGRDAGARRDAGNGIREGASGDGDARLRRSEGAPGHGDDPHGDSRHGDTPHGDSRHGDTPHGDAPGDSRHGDDPRGTPHGDAPTGSPATRLDLEIGSEPAAWAVLAAVGGLGPVGFGALLRRFGSASAVLAAAGSTAGRAAIAELDLEEEHRRLRLADLAPRIAEAADDAPGYISRIRSLGLSVVTLEDPRYPPRLRTIDLPPHVLFVRGDVAALSRRNAVAVVGTRRPSDGGRRTAARISAALARLGATVVSGLAVGIDGAAHAATLDADGCTVAVLAGGHACLYPRVHERLAERIVANGGAVVAELPPDTAPARGTFPRRNRLISGLADATVVVEAGLRSGALITAGWALEQGRECFIVPGTIDAPSSAGCLAFLRMFSAVARIVSGIPELVEDLGIADGASADGRFDAVAGGASEAVGTAAAAGGLLADVGSAGFSGPPSSGGPRQGRLELRDRVLVPARSVLAEAGEIERAIGLRLVAGPCTVDELVAAEDLPVATVLGGLTLLEMRGFVQGSYGRYVAAGPLLAAVPDDVASTGRGTGRSRGRRRDADIRQEPKS